MDELIKLVMQKANLPEAQAKAAIETVVGYLKQQLPAPLASQLDGLLAGNLGGAGDMLSNLGGLGGLFGKDK